MSALKTPLPLGLVKKSLTEESFEEVPVSEEIQEDYIKLNDKLDKVIKKIKSRRKK